jgi:hypothetical protein
MHGAVMLDEAGQVLRPALIWCDTRTQPQCDWLTEKMVASLGLNDRQHASILHLKLRQQITNAEYQRLTGALNRTASRDLDDLVKKGVLRKVGKTGRGAHYVLVPKQVINRTNATSAKADKNRTNRTPASPHKAAHQRQERP